MVPHPQWLFEHFFLQFAHEMFLPLLYKFLTLIHTYLHLQLSIQKHCLYIQSMDLLFHVGSNCEYASIGDELGSRERNIIGVYFDNLKLSLSYELCLVPNNFAQYISLGVINLFASYTFVILWENQFSRSIGYEGVVCFLHCTLSIAYWVVLHVTMLVKFNQYWFFFKWLIYHVISHDKSWLARVGCILDSFAIYFLNLWPKKKPWYNYKTINVINHCLKCNDDI